MILRIEQIEKELFTASFIIWRDTVRMGNMEVKGKLGSMEADISIDLFGKTYELSYAGGLIKSAPLPDKAGKAFRPYQIGGNDGSAGKVYQVDRKESFFSIISFFEMVMESCKYTMYPIGFGREGGKHPVYCGDRQIAQIEKSGEIYNDLHHYSIYALDQTAAELAVLFCAYMYVNANFKPGEKATKSVVKYTSVTTNKTLKSKYDPSFKERIQL